jgi:hypothetical protein
LRIRPRSRWDRPPTRRVFRRSRIERHPRAAAKSRS